MAGTKEGAAKGKITNLKRNPLFFQEIGKKGGSALYKGKKGFASMTPEQRKQAGIKGGTISRRGRSRI